MSLADTLKAAAIEQSSKASTPPDLKEVHARTEFDGTSGYIQTAGIVGTTTPDHDSILTQFGYDPLAVQIVGAPRVSKWEFSYRDLDGEMNTEWKSSYRFNIAPRVNVRATSDIEDLIAAAKVVDPMPPMTNGGYWFVFQAGDLQISKKSRDGSTDEIVQKVVESVAAAKDELRRLSAFYPVAGVQISMPGDCIEGNVSQGGANAWLTRETITEQTRIFRRLLLHIIDEFRFAPKVYVDIVNGNHDGGQRQWNTYPGDGWATECAIAVSDAMELNPAAYGHVEVRIPDKWSGTMTVPVGDSVVTVAHGHQWRPNGAMKWWSEQALHCQPAASAHVLQNGHLHELAVEMSATRTRVQSPTFDCGSDWYRERRGADSPRGAAVYLLRGGKISHLSVV